jgi:hypothetical protein
VEFQAEEGDDEGDDDEDEKNANRDIKN